MLIMKLFPYKAIIISIALVLSCYRLIGNETINDSECGFKMSLPAGFVKFPRLTESNPNITYAYILGNPADDVADIYVFIQRLGKKPLKKMRYSRTQLPRNFKGKLLTVNWKKFKLNGFEVPEKFNGMDFITYNIQIPLKGEPVQLSVFGLKERKTELNSIMMKVLSSLDGESNWTVTRKPPPPQKRIENDKSNSYGYFLLAIGIIFYIAAMSGLMYLSRKSSKWTVLLLALAIYLAGSVFSSYRIREVMMLSGFLKVVGFSGIILGIIDLLRKRKKAKETPENNDENSESTPPPPLYPNDSGM